MGITREQLKVEGTYINRGSKHGSIRQVLMIGEYSVFFRTEFGIENSVKIHEALESWEILSPKREKNEFKAYWVDGGLELLNKDFANVAKVNGKTKLCESFSPDRFDIIPAKGIESVWRYTDDWSVCDG